MKSIKPLIALTIAFGALTLNSCKKDKANTTVSIYLTADVDGTATTFNTNAKAYTATASGQIITEIEGTAKDGSMLVIAVKGVAVAGKTYSDAAISDNDKAVFLYNSAGTNPLSFYNDDDDQNNLPTFTVSTFTSSSISGTFKGKIFSSDINNNTNPTKLITNGKFSLSYSKVN